VSSAFIILKSRRNAVFQLGNQQIDAAIAEVNGALTGERPDQVRDQIKRFWLVNFAPNAFTEGIPEGIVTSQLYLKSEPDCP
jgi:hypothetical protein